MVYGTVALVCRKAMLICSYDHLRWPAAVCSHSTWLYYVLMYNTGTQHVTKNFVFTQTTTLIQFRVFYTFKDCVLYTLKVLFLFCIHLGVVIVYTLMVLFYPGYVRFAAKLLLGIDLTTLSLLLLHSTVSPLQWNDPTFHNIVRYVSPLLVMAQPNIS